MRVFGWFKPLCAMKVTGRNPEREALSTDPGLPAGLSWSIVAETRKMVIYA